MTFAPVYQSGPYSRRPYTDARTYPGQQPAAPTPTSYWRPAAMDAPVAAYPSSASETRRPYRGNFAQRYNASGKGVSNTLGSITPGSFRAAEGTGSYMGPNSYTADKIAQANAADAMANQSTYIKANRAVNGTPGGGGGYGGGSGGLGGLYGEFQSAMDRANAANEARYRDILNGQQARYERGMQMLEGAGAQERADIGEAYDASGASMKQGLIGRGLGNSTVLDTMQMGNQRERQNALGRLNDRLIQQRLAADAALSGDVLNFMERKTENGPSYDQLIQLAQMMGEGGMGGGGAVMAGPPIYESAGAVGYQIPSFGSVAMGGGGGYVGGGGYDRNAARLNHTIRRQQEEMRRAARAPGGGVIDWLGLT